MKNYVVGFLFTLDTEKVVLIKKNRPKWQEGYWNGVGGHIEENETPIQAMIREFHEETGYKYSDWVNYCTITYKDCVVWFFASLIEEWHLKANIKTVTDEEIGIHLVKELPLVIPNLHWLIPLALDPNILKSNAYQI